MTTRRLFLQSWEGPAARPPVLRDSFEPQAPAQSFGIEPRDIHAEPASGGSCAITAWPGGAQHEGAGGLAEAVEPPRQPPTWRERLGQHPRNLSQPSHQLTETFLDLPSWPRTSVRLAV